MNENPLAVIGVDDQWMGRDEPRQLDDMLSVTILNHFIKTTMMNLNLWVWTVLSTKDKSSNHRNLSFAVIDR